MKYRESVLLPVFLAAAISVPLGAQQPLEKLTLAGALDLAVRQNLDLIAARARRAVAAAGVRVAGERPNPTGNFAATRDEPHESVFFDQQVEIGPKRGRRIELARQEGALTDSDIAAFEKQVRQAVRDAYFGLAHARGATAQQADILKLAERLQEIAQARFQTGDIPQLEVTQADLGAARARADFEVAQQEEKVALSDLNALLNEPAATDWDLGDALVTIPETIPLDQLLARAENSNSAVARAAQEVKVQQSQTALFKAERIPNLGLEAGMDFNSPHDFEVGARGGVSLELPIFSRYQGEIAQSLAGERELEGELAASRRAADAGVESAYLDLEARRTQVQLYRDTILPSSRRLEEMAEESYRAGATNILTVLSAQHDVQAAESSYLDSLQAAQTAFAQLEEAVGAPLD